MLRATELLDHPVPAADSLTLPFELRQKSRLVAQSDGGRQVLLQLPRGGVLRHGALLRASDGSVIEIRAAAETLSVVESDDPAALPNYLARGFRPFKTETYETEMERAPAG